MRNLSFAITCAAFSVSMTACTSPPLNMRGLQEARFAEVQRACTETLKAPKGTAPHESCLDILSDHADATKGSADRNGDRISAANCDLRNSGGCVEQSPNEIRWHRAEAACAQIGAPQAMVSTCAARLVASFDASSG